MHISKEKSAVLYNLVLPYLIYIIRIAKKRNHLKNYDFDISIDFDTIKQKMPLCNFCDRMIFLSLCICDKF